MKKDPRHLLVKIAKILNQLEIPYIITGGLSVLVWGRPRFTADIDIVVELEDKQIENLAEALRKLGSYRYINSETIRESLAALGEFNFFDGNSGIKVDFWASKGDAFSISGFKRKIKRKILGKDIYFISPEDLILSKLRWYKITPSSRQLEDVESIFKISKDLLDISYLTRWAKKLNVSKPLSDFLNNHKNPK